MEANLSSLPSDSPIDQIASSLGANGLPYSLPIHPNLVHLTIGLFVIAIAFDIAGALYPLEKRVFRFLALPVTRSGFHDVGWYNLLACCVVTFFTVAAGFYEMLLAVPLPGVTSTFGLESMVTMLWHGGGGVVAGHRGHDRVAWFSTVPLAQGPRPPGPVALSAGGAGHVPFTRTPWHPGRPVGGRIWGSHRRGPTPCRRGRPPYRPALTRPADFVLRLLLLVYDRISKLHQPTGRSWGQPLGWPTDWH